MYPLTRASDPPCARVIRYILQTAPAALHGPNLSSGKPCLAVQPSDGVRRLSHTQILDSIRTGLSSNSLCGLQKYLQYYTCSHFVPSGSHESHLNNFKNIINSYVEKSCYLYKKKRNLLV